MTTAVDNGGAGSLWATRDVEPSPHSHNDQIMLWSGRPTFMNGRWAGVEPDVREICVFEYWRDFHTMFGIELGKGDCVRLDPQLTVIEGQ